VTAGEAANIGVVAGMGERVVDAEGGAAADDVRFRHRHQRRNEARLTDCRPEFLDAFQRVIVTGTRSGVEHAVDFSGYPRRSRRNMSYVLYNMSDVPYYMSHVLRNMNHVSRNINHVSHSMSYVLRYMNYVPRYMNHVSCYMNYVLQYRNHVSSYISYVLRNMSHV